MKGATSPGKTIAVLLQIGQEVVENSVGVGQIGAPQIAGRLGDATRFFAPARGAAEAIDTRVTIVKDSLKYSAGGPLSVSTTLEEVFL